MPVVNAYAGQALFGVIADQYGRVIGGTSANSVILNQTNTNQEASYKITGFGELGTYLGIGALIAPPVDTTNKLYNIDGELYWNGSTVIQSPFSDLHVSGILVADSETTATSTQALTFEDNAVKFGDNIRINSSNGYLLIIGHAAGNATNVAQSTLIGSWSGYGSVNVDSCTMVGYYAGMGVSDVTRCVFLGQSAGSGAPSVSNTSEAVFIGVESGVGTAGANGTVFLGYRSGGGTTATRSLFVSESSGYGCSGNDVIALGAMSAYNMTLAGYTICFGPYTGYGSSTLTFDTFIGMYAGSSVASVQYCSFIGYYAGSGASDTQNSDGIGYYALYNAHTVQYCSFIGYYAGSGASNLQNSDGIGYYALCNAHTLVDSSAHGYYAGYTASNWSRSLALGMYAGERADQISESIFIGYFAGQNTVLFNGCISIGKDVSQGAQKQTDCIHIGSYTGTNSSYGEGVASSSNNIFIGTDAGGSHGGPPCGGNHNIYIGRRAGSNLGIGDGRLVITPHDRGSTDVTALIYGQDNLTSENSVLNLNAVVTARHGVVLPPYFEGNTASTVDTLYNRTIDGASVLFWNGFEVAGRHQPDLKLGLTWVMTGLSATYTPRCCVTSADGSALYIISTESGSQISLTADGIIWSQYPTFGYTGSIVDVIYSSRLGLYVAVQASGSSYVYTSPDIGFWTQVTVPNDCYQNRFVVEDTFHNVVFIAGDYGVASTVDTVTWTSHFHDNLNFSIHGLAYDSENHVVGFIQKTDATGYYFRSTSDGGVTFSTPVFVHGGASSAGLYYAPLSRTWYCYASGSIRYSKDNGETWTSSLGVSSENWFSLIETDVNNVIAIAHQNTTTCGLCKTINGGYNFSNYDLPFGSNTGDIDFIKLAKLPSGRFIMLSQSGNIRSAITV
jgi:hypothetical protein